MERHVPDNFCKGIVFETAFLNGTMITDTITAAVATCRTLPGIELIGTKIF